MWEELDSFYRQAGRKDKGLDGGATILSPYLYCETRCKAESVRFGGWAWAWACE
jgi:hypothetical protein